MLIVAHNWRVLHEHSWPPLSAIKTIGLLSVMIFYPGSLGFAGSRRLPDSPMQSRLTNALMSAAYKFSCKSKSITYYYGK